MTTKQLLKKIQAEDEFIQTLTSQQVRAPRTANVSSIRMIRNPGRCKP
jgi:hypothetical protein